MRVATQQSGVPVPRNLVRFVANLGDTPAGA
jgi:hypothetical protein